MLEALCLLTPNFTLVLGLYFSKRAYKMFHYNMIPMGEYK